LTILAGEDLTAGFDGCTLQDTSKFGTWLNSEKLVKSIEKVMSNGDQVHLVNPFRIEGTFSEN